MHHFDSREAYGEKARWKLHKHVTRCFKQILEETPHKTTAVQSLTSYFTNYTNKTSKTCSALLKKKGRTHKSHSLMDFYTCLCQSSPSSRSVRTLFSLESQPRAIVIGVEGVRVHRSKHNSMRTLKLLNCSIRPIDWT